MCNVCRSLYVLLYFFFLTIVLSVLRFTDSDYPLVSSYSPYTTFVCLMKIDYIMYKFKILYNDIQDRP
jgi:hypothetical protein